ncbi:MAG: metallophosphoesterase [Ignavibacteriales bacterium]|nr:metallophosphoesterase [Ignavibacteriales bacterium]
MGLMMYLKVLRTLLLVSIIFTCYSQSAAYVLQRDNQQQVQSDSISNQIVWQDRFDSNNLSEWEIVDDIPGANSNWRIEKGFLSQTTEIGSKNELLGTHIVNGDSNWKDYIVRTNFINTDDDYVGILFRYQNAENYYRFILSFKQQSLLLDKRVSGKNIEIEKITGYELQSCKYSVIICAEEDSIKVYLNDQLVFQVKDNQFEKGKIGFTTIANLSAFFDDIIVFNRYNIEPQKNEPAIIRGPYLQSVLADSAVIRWNTSSNNISKVEYGINQEAQWTVKDTVLRSIHELTLKNLNSGAKYYYRVLSGNSSTDWYSFKTAPLKNTPFNFIVYGDNQLNFLRHKEIINQFTKHDFDFIVSCGDVVQRGLRKDWDTEFFEPLSGILKEKSFYSAIGNHEMNSPYFYENFSYPNSDHENYYSFKYSNCFFIFIDNPRAAYPDKTVYTDFKEGSGQLKWIEEQLASKEAQEATWLFVVAHVPSYVLGSQDRSIDCKENLVPLFEKYNVDFNFAGHTHGYERGLVNDVNYIVTAGGGGVMSKKEKTVPKKIDGLLKDYNYCFVSVNGNKLTFTAFDIDDNILDQLTLIK